MFVQNQFKVATIILFVCCATLACAPAPNASGASGGSGDAKVAGATANGGSMASGGVILGGSVASGGFIAGGSTSLGGGTSSGGAMAGGSISLGGGVASGGGTTSQGGTSVAQGGAVAAGGISTGGIVLPNTGGAIVGGTGGATTDPCLIPTKCFADKPFTASEIMECQAMIAPGAKCSTEMFAAAVCLKTNQVCDANNKTDVLATVGACPIEVQATNTCLQMP